MFNKGTDKISLTKPKGSARVVYKLARALGLPNFKTSETKQSKLLPSSRLAKLKIPPVKFAGSTPAKLLTLPKLPPMLFS